MVSDTLNDKLDKYSERYGVTKSSIVGFVLGQWMDQVEQMNNAVYGTGANDGFLAEVFSKNKFKNVEQED